MDLKYKILLIKIVYLIGFILDGLTAIDMILSTFMPTAIAIPYASMTPSFQFAMGWGASLMLGWTVLLLWGLIKPVERRVILLFTIIPVVLGLAITELLINPSFFMSMLIFQFCFIIPLFITGYILSMLVDKNDV